MKVVGGTDNRNSVWERSHPGPPRRCRGRSFEDPLVLKIGRSMKRNSRLRENNRNSKDLYPTLKRRRLPEEGKRRDNS